MSNPPTTNPQTTNQLTFATELRRVGLDDREISIALHCSINETRRLLRGNPLRLPEKVYVFPPRGIGDQRHIVMCYAGPFMRIGRFEGQALAEHVAREWERGVYPPHLIGELRRCLRPPNSEPGQQKEKQCTEPL